MGYNRYEQNQLLFNMNFKEAVGDKLVFVGGFIDKLELLEPFVAKYGPDFTPATSQAQAEARQDQPRRSHGPGGSMSSRPPLQGLETPS